VTLAQRLDGWLNPVMVKELRQAVRGRFIVTVLTLSLLAQVVAVGAFMLTDSITSAPVRGSVGDTTFITLFFVLFVGTVFFIPLYSGIRMAVERSDTNVDLLFVTTIKPRTIVIGKLLTTIVLTALMFFASLPFLVFSYVLRGIDILTIFFVLFIAFFAVCSAGVVALFLGCVPATKPFRLLLGVVFFAVTIMVCISMGTIITEIIRSATTTLFLTTDFWSGLGATLLVMCAVDAMLLVTTTVIITPPAANRAFPIRIMMAMLWLASGAVAARLAFRLRDADVMLAWAIAQSVLITIVLCSAVGERERWGPRIARSIPENPLKRFFAFLFFSGAGGGVLWAIVFYLATAGVYEVVLQFKPASLVREKIVPAQTLLEAAMCFLSYLLTAQLLRRRFLHRIPPRATWAIGLAIFLLVAVIPPLVFLAGANRTADLQERYGLVTILNPFPFLDGDPHPARLPVLLIWVQIAALANAAWIAEQWRAFRAPRRFEDANALPLQEGTTA
jgi:hypothetical protein